MDRSGARPRGGRRTLRRSPWRECRNAWIAGPPAVASCCVSHVILSPHPDDAVLSLWHLLAGDEEVAVVNVFGGSPDGHRGDSWWDRLTGTQDSVRRTAERHAEDREALGMVGRAPLDLGFLDGQYRDAEPPLEPIVARIDQAVPEGVLYAPAALDAHRDHRIVLAAAPELRSRDREAAPS